MRLRLEVYEAPPKKDGANSMWRKPAEVPRLKALRLAAAEAVTQEKPPPTGAVHLSLQVYAAPQCGDLDNFITGICDGLMAAHPGTPIDPALWSEVPEGARPDRPILFADDARVARIQAERFEEDSASPHYVLEVEFL